ncbi:solute carrier family 2, facilitated glucose transporter member 5-like [Octopus sinensis]|uniref:Solute carrier family 2, facilitated glucose transporter member 5-like n=1 Tax=Octopus sinensis TaxID=2607531 RepID=A0A6P7U1B6_9MOLL|nr:solute carrier family 2, facilitated glucose transporter member 5-like [Octopus sinensis]
MAITILTFCPESPRWLLMKGRDTKAYEALRKLRKNGNLRLEFDELVNEQNSTTCKPVSIWTVLRKKEFRYPIKIIFVVFFVQQFSGINMILAFSNNIYRNVGLSDENVQYAIIGSGASLLLSSCIAAPFIDTIGRKKLLIYPLAIMILMLIMETIALVYKIYILAIVCLYIYMMSFDISLGVIPQSLMVEYFQQDARSAASSIGVFISSSSNFAALWLFKPVIENEQIKNYVFVIFIVLCSISLVFLQIYVVETVNRKFEDINRDLKKHLNNHNTSQL